MRAYQRFSKCYKVVDSKGRTLGEYTTVDGCYKAAKRNGWTDFEVKPL